MGNPAKQQPGEDLFIESISKKVWRQKEFSALSSSQPLWLLQHPFLRDLGASRFVNASTPSLALPGHTGETQTPSVGPMGLASALRTFRLGFQDAFATATTETAYFFTINISN